MIKKILKAFEDKDIGLLTRMLVYQILDPNKIIPDKGVTFFHLIIGHQSENFAFKITKLFLRYGGDPNVPSDDGVTPIHVAAAWGRTRILHLLLVNGGDPWLQDDERKNAFNYAFEEQEWDVVEMLHHFQQIHSSAFCQRDIEKTPKFDLSLKRILLRKGEEIYEYALQKDTLMKSNKTQTETEIQDKSSSPVMNKINYFESSLVNDENGWKKQEKANIEQSKAYYTSYEVMVNCHDNRSCENNTFIGDNIKEKDKEHFVSSIQIDAPLKTEELSNESVAVMEKSNNSFKKSTGDIRSQLFLELQEAVLRRSKLQANKEQNEKNTQNMAKGNSSNKSIDDIELKPSAPVNNAVKSIKSPAIEDPFIAKEVSYLYGINVMNNSLIRHMSDFATKVMQEIELSEAENSHEKGIGCQSSNTVLSSTYLTCEDESDTKYDDAKFSESPIVFRDDLKNVIENSNDSFLSITEEYKYTDKEKGVVLLEQKHAVTPTASQNFETDKMEVETEESSSISNVSSAPSAISYASDSLRTELTSFGFTPGPITATTKRLYLKKLYRLKKNCKRLTNSKPAFSKELEKTLGSSKAFEKILSHGRLEEEMMRYFDENRNRRWREGTSKTSFNYLLLDPRLSLNLPRRALTMPDPQIWECFLSSVFYIGKGKRTRPYAHLYEAASSWQKGFDRSKSKAKVRRILDIWSEDLGVVCLHVFQNVIPVEAFTREAAMIDAFGLGSLENVKCGEYYGSAATWGSRDKLKLGVYLLYKAMLIFLNEGERQIRPFDIT